METVGKVLGITFVAVILYYLFRDPNGTAQMVTAAGNVFSGGVKALMARD